MLETGAPESLHVSAHHPVPSRVMGSGHHLVPRGAARQTKQLVPCVAWRDSFGHAYRPASSQPSILNESFLRDSSDSCEWGSGVQVNKEHPVETLKEVKGLLRLYRHSGDSLQDKSSLIMTHLHSQINRIIDEGFWGDGIHHQSLQGLLVFLPHCLFPLWVCDVVNIAKQSLFG